MKTLDAPKTPISIRLEVPIAAHLRRIARQQALDRDEDVTVSDIIREAIMDRYPCVRTDENREVPA